MLSAPPPIPFRVRIGVTGHRVLPQDPALEQQVGEVIERIKNDCCRKAALPIAFTVITPLAEGADQWIATMIMKLPDSHLQAVIPLALSDYLADFSSEQMRQVFTDLLKHDHDPVFVRTLPLDPRLTPEQNERARNSAYREAGEYVVRNCDVLIAVWDREPARGEGGTAEIVRYAEARRIPVYVIPTKPPLNHEVRKGAGLGFEGLEAWDLFNRAHVNAVDATRRDPSFNTILDSTQRFNLPAENSAVVKERIRPYYLRASYLALRYQRLHYQLGGWVYSLAAFVILIATLSSLMAAHTWVFAVGELLAMLLIVLIVHFARRNNYQRMWVDYRLLAERLRIGAVLVSCGIPERLTQNHTGLSGWLVRRDWTSRAASEILSPLSQGLIVPPLEAQREFLRKCWIQDQVNYHQKKTQNFQRRYRRLDTIGTLTFYTALVVVAVNLTTLVFQWNLAAGIVIQWLGLSSLALPAFGAAFTGIRKHREYDRLSAKSAAMMLLLDEMDVRAANADTEEQLQKVLNETYQVVVSEAEDWHLFVRELALETPA